MPFILQSLISRVDVSLFARSEAALLKLRLILGSFQSDVAKKSREEEKEKAIGNQVEAERFNGVEWAHCEIVLIGDIDWRITRR